MSKFNFKQHAERMQMRLRRVREIYDMLGQRFSVNPHIVLWRTRYRAIYLFSAMGLWLQKHPPKPYGATIAKWRRSQKHLGAMITRQILVTGAAQERFTRAEIEVALGDYAGEQAIKTVLRTGQELGILERDGKYYSVTDLAINEAFDRVMFKIMDPDIIAFAEFVVMFNNMRKNAEHVGDLEKNGRIGSGNFRTMAEEIYYGTYDDDVFGTENDSYEDENRTESSRKTSSNQAKIVRVK